MEDGQWEVVQVGGLDDGGVDEVDEIDTEGGASGRSNDHDGREADNVYVSSPVRVSKRKAPTCKRCLLHGADSFLAGHACPYQPCRCAACVELLIRRRANARQAKECYHRSRNKLLLREQVSASNTFLPEQSSGTTFLPMAGLASVALPVGGTGESVSAGRVDGGSQQSHLTPFTGGKESGSTTRLAAAMERTSPLDLLVSPSTPRAPGLALFGLRWASAGLIRALAEAVAWGAAPLLYAVEDVGGVGGGDVIDVTEGLASLGHIRIIRPQDADIVLNDQRVSGVLVCSPATEASTIVLAALRAGKGVLCGRLLGPEPEIVTECFEEAEAAGKPLVCGLYRRFDPSLRLLHSRIRAQPGLGRLLHLTSSSHGLSPPCSSAAYAHGSIFYDSVVHDLDTLCWLVGETQPDILHSSGITFTAEAGEAGDADAVSVALRFSHGAVGVVDVGRWAAGGWELHVKVRGSEGTLCLESSSAFGLSARGSACTIGQGSGHPGDRLSEAYRHLLLHFLRTLHGQEMPLVGQDEYQAVIELVRAAENTWAANRAGDASGEAVVKTEVP
uniref:DM domain-containing protein n=1 Tax=Eptatretus burgeri TaxID=7764 RepID=A0A8C4X0P6_EPTBU